MQPKNPMASRFFQFLFELYLVLVLANTLQQSVLVV